MGADLEKLLSQGKTYLWTLRHAQIRGVTPEKIKEVNESLAADGIDVTTLLALRQLEPCIARSPYPSAQRAHHQDYYFFPIPAFDIEVFFKVMITEPGLEVGMELFPKFVDWQFSHNEIQYCIGGDVRVDMVLPNNVEMSRQVRVGDVVAVPAGTNFMTHSSEEGGKFGHAHIFLTNTGNARGDIFYDVGGMLRLQSLGMMDPAPPGALPFSDITDRIELKNWSDLLTVHQDRKRDLPSWLRNGWKRREETRALDYAEGTRTVVMSSPDRELKDFIEWGKGKRKCYVNPLIAEQTAAITDCHFPAGYKRLQPCKEAWVVLNGQGKIKQSVPPLHSEWVELDLQAHDVVVAANGAHVYVLEATDDFIVRRLAETCAHNNHASMMELKLELYGADRAL
jgi:hypothetical protein